MQLKEHSPQQLASQRKRRKTLRGGGHCLDTRAALFSNCFGDSTETEHIFPPPNLVWLLTLTMSQTHQKYVKSFISHMTRISRKSKVTLKQVLKWLERVGKENGLGVF